MLRTICCEDQKGEFTFNGSWITVASTNDYVASFTGHIMPPAGGTPTSRSFTLTLRELPVGVTTILVDNATSLKGRDNFLIAGPAPNRFLQVTVTAAP